MPDWDDERPDILGRSIAANIPPKAFQVSPAQRRMLIGILLSAPVIGILIYLLARH